MYRWLLNTLLLNISGLQRTTKNLRNVSNMKDMELKPADPQLKRGNWRKENIKGLVMNIFRERRDFTGETRTKDYTRRKNPKQTVVMATHLCQFTKNHCIIHLKWMNVMLCKLYSQNIVIKKGIIRDFPCGPVVKTPCSQCRGLGFDPWSEN